MVIGRGNFSVKLYFVPNADGDSGASSFFLQQQQ